MPNNTPKKEGIFFYLLLLTGFLFLLEVSYFVEGNRTYAAALNLVTTRLHIPTTILPAIIYFVSVELLLHVIYCLFIWIVTVNIFPSSLRGQQNRLLLGFGLWLLGVITILTVNQYYYPNSKYAILSGIFLRSAASAHIVFIILSALWVLLIVLAGFNLLRRISKPILYLLIVLSLMGWFFTKLFATAAAQTTFAQPNIIIVGVDSLRPDFVGYFGGAYKTPFFDDFLNHATVFGETVTPLARTFPSWTGILTGEYPLQSGVRTNLAIQDHLDLTNTLPAILRRHGYETIFSTDETRFSNVGKDFGFDHIVTPGMGLDDFILGTFNDFPLSNLVVNSPLGRWLFPYSYGNRPVWFTYDPNSFLHLIAPVLAAHRHQPLFLAIHFCLPHDPYLWAGLPGINYTAQERYAKAVERSDQQVQDFFAILQQDHLLDHAIVVLLSDHGEALEFPGDRITQQDLFTNGSQQAGAVPQFYPPSLDDETVDESAGHGTDVLGFPQYHPVLAFRLYGMSMPQQAADITGIVSLLDIKPTILHLLNLPAPDSSGVSLVNTIQGKSTVAPEQPIFMESDFSPRAILTVYPQAQEALLEGAQLFQINPKTLELTVKQNMLNLIIRSKQYAVIDGHWVLALYPQNQHYRMPILVNLQTGEWTNNLQSPFAQQSPATQMLASLRTFYGHEIGRVE